MRHNTTAKMGTRTTSNEARFPKARIAPIPAAKAPERVRFLLASILSWPRNILMSDVPRVLQSRTEKLVRSSYVLGIASIFCGITALPAIIYSIRALVCMRKETVSKGAYRKVIFSLLFSSCVLAFVIFSVGSAFLAAQGLADRMKCVNNMKTLGLAIK